VALFVHTDGLIDVARLIYGFRIFSMNAPIGCMSDRYGRNEMRPTISFDVLLIFHIWNISTGRHIRSPNKDWFLHKQHNKESKVKYVTKNLRFISRERLQSSGMWCRVYW